MTDSLRTRIAAAIMQSCHGVYMDDAVNAADAIIRELDSVFLNFGLWLSEELRGEPMSRIDAESCLQEWKWLNDESRWLRGEWKGSNE